MACGGLLIGIVLILRLPVPFLIRLVLVAVWAGGAAWEIGRQSRAFSRVDQIRIAPGCAAVSGAGGREEPVRIMSGSVVLQAFAWLRLRLPDGVMYGELLRRSGSDDADWRRLLVLWGLGRGSFGANG